MKMKKIMAVALAMCVSASVCAGCGNGDSDSSASETVVTTKAPETPEEFHEAMVARSLVSFGRTERMQKKLTSAQNGEEITVAYIGGSITEGLTAGANDCYAKLSFDYISETFGTGSNVKYVNAGISGTPSILGAMRSERDVISKNADIVFIEFAVNDGGDADYRNAFESLVRTLLKQENEPAVILLFNRTEDGHTVQDNMKAVGEYYQLPMISVVDAITPEIDEGRMTWDDYSDDGSHPNFVGHKMVAELIQNYFEQVMSVEYSDEAWVMPEEAFFGKTLEDAKMFDNTNTEPTELGSFVPRSTIAYFKDGWQHDANSETNEPIVFNVKAKCLYLIYRTNSTGNLGDVVVTIKTAGEEDVTEYTISGITSDGWNNPVTQLLKMRGVLNDYEVSIRMADGSENKQFEILGFGYTE